MNAAKKNASEKRLAKVKNALTEVRIHDFTMGELSAELKRLGAPYGISVPAILKKASIMVESSIKGCFNLTDRSMWDMKVLTEELDKLSATVSTYKIKWREKKEDESVEMVRTKPAKVSNTVTKQTPKKVIPATADSEREKEAIALLKSLGYKLRRPFITYKQI